MGYLAPPSPHVPGGDTTERDRTAGRPRGVCCHHRLDLGERLFCELSPTTSGSEAQNAGHRSAPYPAFGHSGILAEELPGMVPTCGRSPFSRRPYVPIWCGRRYGRNRSGSIDLG